MQYPKSDQEFRKLLDEIMSNNPQPELSAAEIRFYAMIGDALELVGDLVVWLN
jgi:hypothetical protein